ncbi:chemosensory pili system protein ChpC [Gammaproteobacteria bacterium]
MNPAPGLPTSVRCLVLPLGDWRLLIPNTAVAEIIGYQEPSQPAQAAPWLLGFQTWRGLPLPILDLVQSFLDLPITGTTYRSRVVVCRLLNQDQQLSHIGLYSKGIPKLALVSPETLMSADYPMPTGSLTPWVCLLAGQLTLIPDLDLIAQQLKADPAYQSIQKTPV